jgi:hypothetical protein
MVYQPLYSVVGVLSGALKIGATAERAVTGTLDWVKPAQRPGSLYAAGWPVPISMTVTGGRYRPVSGATLVFDAPVSAQFQMELLLANGNISAIGADPRVKGFFLSAPARVLISAPDKLSINPATGAITGTVVFGRDKLTLSGLVIPDATTATPFDGKGLGFFVLPAATPRPASVGSLTVQVSSP